MIPFNDSGNLKQFQLIRFINKNSEDSHITTKISIILRRDKIEAPYYMDTKIRLTSCVDNENSGIVHAMDILNHHRMYNLTEEAYFEIEHLLDNAFNDESDGVKITQKEKELKIVLISKNSTESENIFKKYSEVFEKIDNLIV